MININSGDKTNLPQKVFAFGILGALGYGAVLLLNSVIPPITQLMKNIWELALYGIPLALIVLYVVSNPLMVWGFFKTLSWKLTSWMIKLDPLSVMDRYVDYLRKKLIGLNQTVTVLTGKKSKLDRNIADLKSKIEYNAKMGASAISQGLQNEASAYGVKVQTDRNTISLLLPLQTRLDKSLEFLSALSDNWKFGIEKLEYQIQGKRTEYEIIKETTKGLKNAEDFINSDNEAARIYGQSLKALEESVTQKIGYIEEFERRSKGLMSSINIEKKAIQDEGLKELEKYMKDGNLVLPDFSKLADGDLAYEMVKPKSSSNTNEFNL